MALRRDVLAVDLNEWQQRRGTRKVEDNRGRELAPAAGQHMREEQRVRMTLRVSRDSGRTWGPVVAVRGGAHPWHLDNPTRPPPCACARCAELQESGDGAGQNRCAARIAPASRLLRDVRLSSGVRLDEADGRCQLPGHADGSHYALLAEAGPCTGLWASWDAHECRISVLADCPVTSPEACCLFLGHPGPHT